MNMERDAHAGRIGSQAPKWLDGRRGKESPDRGNTAERQTRGVSLGCDERETFIVQSAGNQSRRSTHHSGVAQLVERSPVTRLVAGSSPAPGASTQFAQSDVANERTD